MEDIELDKRRTYGTHSTSHISHGVGPDARHRGLRGVVDDDPETEEQQMSYYYSHFHFRQPFFVNVVIILCLITFLYSLYLGGFVLAPFDLNPTLGVSFGKLLALVYGYNSDVDIYESPNTHMLS